MTYNDNLTDKSHRFFRANILLGTEMQQKIQDLHVCIVGVGGVGGAVVEAAARLGINNITLIDHDTVDITNSNRQLIALDNNVGKVKVDEWKQRVLSINPLCNVIAIKEFVNDSNMKTFIKKEFTVVFDCIDTILSKIALVKYCVKNNIKVYSAGGAGNKIDPSLVLVKDIKETHSCKLVKQLREALKRDKITRGVKVVFSSECALEPIRKGKGQGRPVNGTISYLPNIFGFTLFAAWSCQAIKQAREQVAKDMKSKLNIHSINLNEIKKHKANLDNIKGNESLKRKRDSADKKDVIARYVLLEDIDFISKEVEKISIYNDMIRTEEKQQGYYQICWKFETFDHALKVLKSKYICKDNRKYKFRVAKD